MFSFGFETLDITTICRALGLFGFALYVAGFYCLCTGRLDSSTPPYFALVFVASSCVLASLMVDFNLSAVLIQTFYVVMSLSAVAFRWRAWNAGR